MIFQSLCDYSRDWGEVTAHIHVPYSPPQLLKEGIQSCGSKDQSVAFSKVNNQQRKAMLNRPCFSLLTVADWMLSAKTVWLLHSFPLWSQHGVLASVAQIWWSVAERAHGVFFAMNICHYLQRQKYLASSFSQFLFRSQLTWLNRETHKCLWFWQGCFNYGSENE